LNDPQTLVTADVGTVCGKRQQAGIIDSDDGYQAVSSSAWLASLDPLLPDEGSN